MLIIKGVGKKAGEIPVGLNEAKDYFSDLPGFIKKISDVDTVRALSVPDSYLVTHVPIGAMNFYTTVVYALRTEWSERGMLLKPLDFDTDKIKSEHQVLKGFVNGELVLDQVAEDRTQAALHFELSVELPVPGMLRLVPQGLIQSTADGIMNVRVGAAVESLYGRVYEDFNLAV